MWKYIEYDLDRVEMCGVIDEVLEETELNPEDYVDNLGLDYTKFQPNKSEMIFICEGNIRYHFWRR